MFVCVCVCVRERERETGRQGDRQAEKEKENVRKVKNASIEERSEGKVKNERKKKEK